MEPENGKLFCKIHTYDLKKAGISDSILGFARKINREDVIEAIEDNDSNLTDHEHCALEDILRRVTNCVGNSDLTTADIQGTINTH